MGPSPKQDFRLFVAVTDVPPNGKEISFVADEVARKELARRFGIPRACCAGRDDERDAASLLLVSVELVLG